MTTAHDFSMKTIDGTEKKLSDYKGKAVLFVNVASECGYTPQYKGLEELHKKLGPKGLAVVGIPCNQFGAQEPGTEKEIAAFCEKNYGVTFDLMSKVDVNGANAHPLYKWLTAQGQKPGDIKWNFGKFLVDKDGNFVERFSHRVEPDAPDLVKAIEKTLT
jgi:glutathione peroxidase